MWIGHLATYRALEHVINGRTVRELLEEDFQWRDDGWAYRLG
jgi:probable phosphoglycerate mutase